MTNGDPHNTARSSIFASLRYPGAKRYFAGLTLSMIGTWMQSIAMSWLVVKKLGGSGRELGLLSIFQFTPMLVLGAWAGALSDRVDKRRVMFVTQTLLGCAALSLALLDFTDRATLPAVLGVAAISGLAGAFDTPVRRAMVGDLVPKVALPNAMSLNTGVITSSRVFGMALGGFVTRFGGTGYCFLANGLSYLAMLVALRGLGQRAHRSDRPTEKAGARDAVAHIARTPALAVSMLATIVVATLTFNYQLTFPLLVKEVFHRKADALGTMLAITSVGSFAGAMLSARRRTPSLRLFLASATLMGASACVMAIAPSFWFACGASIPMGVGGGLLMSQLSGLLTSLSPSTMRGRVLGLQSVVFMGSTPFGGPLLGAVADTAGPRWAMGTGGIAAVAAGLAGLAWVRLRSPDVVPAAGNRAGGLRSASG